MALIDARLLITMTAITLVITAAAVILAWVANRRVYGVRYWSIGFLLLAAGSFLHSFQGLLDPLLSIGFANTLIASGFFLSWSGARAFQRREPGSPAQFLLVAGGVVLVHLLVGLDPEGFVGRAVAVSLVIGSMGLLIARELLLSPTGIRPMSDTLSGLLFLLLGLSFVVRAVLAPLVERVNLIVEENPFNHTTFVLAIVFNTLIAFAYLIMLTERHNARIPHLIDTDLVTGIYNEEGMKKAARRLFADTPNPIYRYAVLLFELPWLDTHSEPAQGVHASTLERLVTLLNKIFREQDLIGRLRGGRFVACMRLRREQDGEQIRLRLDESVGYIARESGVNAEALRSVLVVAPSSGRAEYSQLLQQAKQRLYTQAT